MNPESVDVTAGLGGFLAFFLLAVALYLLMRNMNGRLRRMAYREEMEASGGHGGHGGHGGLQPEKPTSSGSTPEGSHEGPDQGRQPGQSGPDA